MLMIKFRFSGVDKSIVYEGKFSIQKEIQVISIESIKKSLEKDTLKKDLDLLFDEAKYKKLNDLDKFYYLSLLGLKRKIFHEITRSPEAPKEGLSLAKNLIRTLSRAVKDYRSRLVENAGFRVLKITKVRDDLEKEQKKAKEFLEKCKKLAMESGMTFIEPEILSLNPTYNNYLKDLNQRTKELNEKQQKIEENERNIGIHLFIFINSYL